MVDTKSGALDGALSNWSAGGRSRRRWRLVTTAAVILVLGSGLAAYWWTSRHQPPDARLYRLFFNLPRVTRTADGRSGDPLNVGLVGTEAQVLAVMAAAGWCTSDPPPVRNRAETAMGTVFQWHADTTRVTNRFLFGRREDLGFEQYEQIAEGRRHRRHHVRLWRTDNVDRDGRPVWVGSAIGQRGIGLNTNTRQIAHRIFPDIDVEREFLAGQLEPTEGLAESARLDKFHGSLQGRNDAEDPWRTDGAVWVGVIRPKAEETLPQPADSRSPHAIGGDPAAGQR